MADEYSRHGLLILFDDIIKKQLILCPDFLNLAVWFIPFSMTGRTNADFRAEIRIPVVPSG
jgi:hypothetical protein